MKLYIAGGVYEHGRNCFYISRDNKCNIMVDCGVKEVKNIIRFLMKCR